MGAHGSASVRLAAATSETNGAIAEDTARQARLDLLAAAGRFP